MIYAVVTAGGIPKPDEPLYEHTRGSNKAMLDVAGKPMIQWVLDALSGAKTIDGVLVMGLGPETGLSCSKPIQFTPNQASMLENILAGIRRVLEIEPNAHHILLVSSDIPAITPEMVDWVVNAALETDDDVYYNVIPREIMDARYPGSRRSFTRLKDIEVCGGDMNVVRTLLATGKDELWDRIISARKNIFKQASLLGYDVLIQLLFRAITLKEAEKKASKRLGLKGHVIVCPYAEVGMDVDKPHQLEMMRKDMEGRRPA